MSASKSSPPQGNVNQSPDGGTVAVNAAREQLSNNIVGMYEMQRRVKTVSL